MKPMKYKTAELERDLLNAAVAKAEGLPVHPGPGRFMVASPINQRWAHEFDWAGSWKDGGPIIERERITLEWRDREEWWNNEQVSGPRWVAGAPGGSPAQLGPDPLIAAMRAYIASRFGEEVELP